MYRTNKPKFCYHISTEQGTVCKMQNCSSYSKLDATTTEPPPGRKLCAICAQLTGVPVPPVLDNSVHVLAPAKVRPATDAAGCDKLLAYFGVAIRKQSEGYKDASIRACQEQYVRLTGAPHPCLSWEAARNALGILKSGGAIPAAPGGKVIRVEKPAKRKHRQPLIGSPAYQALAQANRERQAAEAATLQAQREASREAKAKLKEAQRPKVKVAKPKSSKPRLNLSPERIAFIISDAFLASREWRAIRYDALRKNDGRCELCGMGKQHGAVLNVDQIKPRRRFPELSLDINNLQILCSTCNAGKGNRCTRDWRQEPDPLDAAIPWERFEGF